MWLSSGVLQGGLPSFYPGGGMCVFRGRFRGGSDVGHGCEKYITRLIVTESLQKHGGNNCYAQK